MSTPVFVRRKQSTKRRSRAPLDSTDTPLAPRPTAAPPAKAPSANASSANALSANAQTANAQTANAFPHPRLTAKRAPRARLRAPPPVLGYDATDPVAQPVPTLHPRYSNAELNALRVSTANRQANQHLPTAAQPSPAATERPVPDDAPPSAPTPTPPSVPTPTPLPRVGGADANGRADPFSKEWRRTPNAERLDSAPSLADAELEADAAPFTYGGVREDSDDAEHAEHERHWQTQLLRRAGVDVRAATQVARTHHDRQQQRAARARFLHLCDGGDDDDVDIVKGRMALETMLVDVARKRDEARLIVHAAVGKEASILAAIASAERAQQHMTDCSRADGDTLLFYEDFARDIDLLGALLGNKRAEMLQVRDARLAYLHKRAVLVKDFLQGGTDEFGRIRRAGTGSRFPEEDNALQSQFNGMLHSEQDVLSDVPEALRSIGKLAHRFDEWRAHFADDYAHAFGDAALGRMAGALGSCEPDLYWLGLLNERQRVEACSVCDVVEEAMETVRARWQPTDEPSCDAMCAMVQAVVHEVKDGRRMALAVRERVEDELCAAQLAADAPWTWEAVRGGLRLCAAVRDVVLADHVLAAAACVDVGRMQDDPRLSDVVAWLGVHASSIGGAARIVLDRIIGSRM